MLTLKTILVPIDFSPTSARALDYAIELASRLDASVTILHAYEVPVYSFPDGAIIGTAEIAGRLADAAKKAMDDVVSARAASGVKVTGVLRQGIPVDEIHAVAEEVGADLVVIGTHGRRGLARALLGSVAEQVIRTATRPVLAIHAVQGS